MRKHNSSVSSNEDINGCYTSDEALCVNTTRSTLKLGCSHIISFCEFNGISSPVLKGGVIYLSNYRSSEPISLTISHSSFEMCNTTGSFVAEEGGGVIYAGCGSLSITSSSFISCQSPSYGGAILAQFNCTSSCLSHCTFISCRAHHGGSIMTEYGPTSSIFSSRFISCVADYVGGGMYHDINDVSDSVTIRKSLFTRNPADYKNEFEDKIRGGGAFEDFQEAAYGVHYFFSFFTLNVAQSGSGHDISLIKHPITQDSFTSCFTTTSINSFWNNHTHEINWLPLINTHVTFYDSLC